MRIKWGYKTCFFLVCLNFNCFGQTFVPDDNFEQALIDLGYDSGPLDDFVPTLNINSITNLDIPSKNISDLTGIEDFLALEKFDLSNNNITVLDISKNINLNILWCHYNQLTSLDVSNNTRLISLRCENNLIVNLDVSKNTNLNVLTCENNQITTLNISDNSTLDRLQCGNNALSNLDLSKNTDLLYLSCEQNQIESLNLNNNTHLRVLFCFENLLTDLNLSNNRSLEVLNCKFNELNTLDLSVNSNLTNLDCSDNQLCRLNIKNGNNNSMVIMNFEFNPDLNCVVVDNINDNHSSWEPFSFSNYVNTPNDCSNFVLIDSLNNFIGTSYTLPALTNGNYFTQSNGHGIALNAGDIITNTQTIYIYKETICNTSNETSFNIFITNQDYYIPKYFTPNNDGYHDSWQVFDKNGSINNISIYSRYGKLLKYLRSDSPGWDGTFNGRLLKSDDYWYIIVFNTGEALKGHFTLKR
ncbi:hypothetical protein A8C32_18540 [Flavivirga aquatica]|uniref:T9SS type B sorting domain-containing protein n=1 Tax=Flavivirga aquatica TaxID=1849968 RepID=A0A1E5T3S3_9FLAO|nr:T9SS type B sorting domain-containing protein [Flavivirga aquatica]OEK06035.1 hypothetical protein A8C32_18540 [Flavivirga aquatica]